MFCKKIIKKSILKSEMFTERTKRMITINIFWYSLFYRVRIIKWKELKEDIIYT